jgi:hypothetical protein
VAAMDRLRVLSLSIALPGTGRWLWPPNSLTADIFLRSPGPGHEQTATSDCLRAHPSQGCCERRGQLHRRSQLKRAVYLRTKAGDKGSTLPTIPDEPARWAIRARLALRQRLSRVDRQRQTARGSEGDWARRGQTIG